MAGSLKWMVYTSDFGAEFAVFTDESKGEESGFRDYVAADSTLPILPRNQLKMRYVNVVRPGASGEDVKRKLYVGTLTRFSELIADRAVTFDSSTWNVTSAVGERRTRLPKALDTAINDGDIT